MSVSFDDKAVKKELEQQLSILERGTVDILPMDEFKQKIYFSIAQKKPLRVKQGFDPTSPDIHLGHTVGLRKLKQFQELGHQIVLIVGDYTAAVGDPSGLSATRPTLSYDDIMRNAETYQTQFFRILDKSKTEVRFNSEWFKKMEFLEVIHLTSKFTVARLLERDDFTKRFKANIPISVHELLYPLMQAYDSVAIKADIELGGTEQKFNLLAGRTIQEAYSVIPQCIMTLPILVGLDGEKKMSKSLGNYIGITESPKEIFGKAMSIPDNQIIKYFKLATTLASGDIDKIERSMSVSNANPMPFKKELGETLVDLFHPEGSGRAAREEFERVFSKKELPDEIEQIDISGLTKHEINPEKIYLAMLMTKTGMTKSNSEARKLIEAGGVTLGAEKITDPAYEFGIKETTILKVGKRRYLKIVV
ncbi:MAG: tyrosine--tRNA ligase [candidate division Zixibacteria bacterium]|nr:tyrosine--tRNA ligase [candidate division Zixibacteria bacterium]